MTIQVELKELLKCTWASVKTRIESVELTPEGVFAILLGCLDGPTVASHPQPACLFENLLLAGSSEHAERFNGFSQVLRASVLEILKVPTVLHFTLMPEDEMSRALLLRQIVVVLSREQVNIGIPYPERFCRYLAFGEHARFHRE